MKNKLYLINGPLGAGKTTFLKFLLSQNAFQQARVIENEFASTSVDTEELHDHIGEVETIAGLCICCSTGTELIDALLKLKETPQPVIIEATGVANSLKLVEKLVANDMLDYYEIARSFFVVDAAEITTNDEIIAKHGNEIAAADVVIATKTDLLAAAQKAKALKLLTQATPGKVAVATMGHLPTALLDGTSGIVAYFAASDAKFTNHDEDTNYTIIDVEGITLTPNTITRAWNTLRIPYGLKRLKGNGRDGEGKVWHVEATPSQCVVTERTGSPLLQLVFIGTNARRITEAILKEQLHYEATS